MAKKRAAPPWSDPAIREYNRIVDEYAKESDRAAAILAASHLEVLVEWVLRAYLVESKTTNDLFESNAPLSTFSGKVKCAFALGLMQPSALHDFDIVRRVRNRFAHETEVASFDATPVVEWCHTFAQVKWPGQKTSDKPKESRDLFLQAVAALSAWADWTLDQMNAGTRPRCVPPPESERFGE